MYFSTIGELCLYKVVFPFQRLLENTPKDHPDQILLLKAEDALHHLALRINSVKESKHEEDMQETLKKIELLLITDVSCPGFKKIFQYNDLY